MSQGRSLPNLSYYPSNHPFRNSNNPGLARTLTGPVFRDGTKHRG